jgi:hypothetical protein
MKTLTISDIEQWVDNDEGLYSWWKSERIPKRQFIKENRKQLEAAINKVLGNEQPAHFLKYGGRL